MKLITATEKVERILNKEISEYRVGHSSYQSDFARALHLREQLFSCVDRILDGDTEIPQIVGVIQRALNYGPEVENLVLQLGAQRNTTVSTVLPAPIAEAVFHYRRKR